MVSTSKRLVDLAIQHKSDKWNNHWFAAIYDDYFQARRHQPIKLLEIGIGGRDELGDACASLRMWEEYFPAAMIYGLDSGLHAGMSQGRIVALEGRQSDAELLRKLSADAGGFDIIIDNGTHLMSDVIATFQVMFPLLNDAGLYAVECLQTSYWPRYGGNSIDLCRTDTSVGFLKTLVDGLNFEERLAPGYSPSYFDKNVTGAHFYHNLALIEKGSNSRPSIVVLNNEPRPGCEDIANGPLGQGAKDQRLRSDALIASFCRTQLQPWADHRFSFEEMVTQLDALSVDHLNIFVFEINGNAVSLHRSAAIQALLDAGHQPESLRRAEIYRRLFESAVRLHPLPKPIALAVDVGDKAPDQMLAPVFSFQKSIGQVNPLLPDMEIVDLSFLEAVPRDSSPYASKRTMAVFVGSTSGKDVITMEDLDSNTVPRVRAARFFRNSDLVDFKLPNIVQCASEEVAQRLRDEGFGTERVQWLDTFPYKFQLSMDGNGAACSRPAIALRGNSVLMSYASDYVLYYSSGLIPWLHYIPINADSDVLTIVKQEKARPGTFLTVAEAGRAFAENILTRESILLYTGRILEMYSDLFRD